MQSTDLLISHRDNTYIVKVTGRADFEYAVPLRNIAKSSGSISGIVIDLGACIAMDSTFMGVLTMLALKGRREQITVELYNAGSVLQKLLRDLGVIKLFTFKEGSVDVSAENTGVSEKSELLTTAETVSEAHKALVGADSANSEKFRAVIDYADADVERLKKEQNK